VRPNANTLPCSSINAPSIGLSQASRCAVAGSIDPTPSMCRPPIPVRTFPRERF
jgi:hypothetical protein